MLKSMLTIWRFLPVRRAEGGSKVTFDERETKLMALIEWSN